MMWKILIMDLGETGFSIEEQTEFESNCLQEKK